MKRKIATPLLVVAMLALNLALTAAPAQAIVAALSFNPAAHALAVGGSPDLSVDSRPVTGPICL